MEPKTLQELSDQELLAEAKKIKRTNVMDAVFVGFLLGIVLYSIFNKTFGVLMLIPIYMIYKFINKPRYKNDEVKQLLAERGLKL
jgi:hypothetical protein